MATKRYIQRVTDDAGQKKRSVTWYRNKIKELGAPQRSHLLKDGKIRNMVQPGLMNLFVYDPKLKKTLPYYDTFPLIIPLEMYNDGFLGINFHYLPRPLRIALLDEVKKYQRTGKVAVNYQVLKRIKLIKPCIKRYLYSQVQSNFRIIEVDEFEAAVMLPVQNFQKATTGKVYSDSRRML